ncbi:uncharacterized protein UV8b_06984 [Ustilaginoidea virens]|uniref:PAC domain-containing protein n=2 Tax=Ustilaginoidea virens TaxID=1159556 RepID=A0A8E5MJL5_USTVR|nr:uncharacterized protein UV8b_06984 [Ustilaginoidea virens]QUC22743.1 hypothetical protein UV8b_06984 [Ustilaginoidea virens]
MGISCETEHSAPFTNIPPLSPTGSSNSSQSEQSLDEPDFSVKPLPLPPSPLPAKPGKDDGKLPALQIVQGDCDGLDPIPEDELDPGSFDLVMPVEQNDSGSLKYKLERRSELLFSNSHLQSIFDDSAHLHRFSNFLHGHRPGSVPLLTYFLDALKALRAIEYSNAVLRQLGPLADFEFTHEFYQAQHTSNPELQEKANAAFDILAREDLPMYITHVWIQTVSVSIRHRIMGTPGSASEGLAEVFCLTDPSRHDNPIVFMSEEFNRTTQYGCDYVIGRNCRFLQGPFTNPFSIARIREKIEAGVEHYETFLNYRRDGSPFMNLVMIAPLYDSRGAIRYFIGAQVDVSGLAMGCYDLGALEKVIDEDAAAEAGKPRLPQPKDELTQLAEILGPNELEVVHERGGDMHRLPLRSETGFRSDEKIAVAKPPGRASCEKATAHARDGSRNRVVLGQPAPRDPAALKTQAGTTAASLAAHHNGRLTGVYEHYLLVRPYPSLRILFASPSMRVPGILQSPLLDRVGGSEQMRDQLVEALANGQSVTAKVKWLTSSQRPSASRRCGRRHGKNPHGNHPLEAHLDADDDDVDAAREAESMGRSRWLHCTPLVGSNGKVGVWMIVIVDDESQPESLAARRSHAVTTNTTTTTKHPSAVSEQCPEMNRSQGARPATRPRRDSETLGRPTAAPSPRSEDASAAKTVQSQHSASGLRAPRPSLKSPGVPARFFTLDALSRAATARRAASGPAAPASDPIPQRRDRSRSRPAGPAEERLDIPAQSWPTPPNSPRGSKQSRTREATARVPSVIHEVPAGKSGSRSRGSREADAVSLRSQASQLSQSSAFTVKIEEAS